MEIEEIKDKDITTISDEHQRVITEDYRNRKVFSLFAFIIVSGFNSDFIRTNRWFKFVEITEQKVFERYQYFDDGWSYMMYWGKWEENWKFVKLNTK